MKEKQKVKWHVSVKPEKSIEKEIRIFKICKDSFLSKIVFYREV